MPLTKLKKFPFRTSVLIMIVKGCYILNCIRSLAEFMEIIIQVSYLLIW